MCSCSSGIKKSGGLAGKVKLITLDPGHFHAALIQKSVYGQIDSNVYVYAPAGEDVNNHLKRIENYNNRAENPTNWNEIVYRGPDFFERMLKEKSGNVVVLAGNNRIKTQYIKASVDAGLNVLSDKPMSVNMVNFELLKESFKIAKQKKVLLYDIMTERSEITTILQKEFSLDRNIFGTLEKGTLENPAVTKESIHHFYKSVSGSVLKRPAWFFDVLQQGEGIVDVTTHLVDLVQWECFPEQVIDYLNDIEVVNAKHWPTNISLAEFKEVTKLNSFPEYLKKDIKDSILNVYANGEINYKVKGVCAKVSVVWNFKAPAGGGDAHFSVLRGTRANLIIRQGQEQNYKPTLYIESVNKINKDEFTGLLSESVKQIQTKYPGVAVKKVADYWEVVIPEEYKVGHEEHFAQVTERYLEYLKNGELPGWEVPNMLAKYYTTAKALEIAQRR
jgi:predicted dehydrogenase